MFDAAVFDFTERANKHRTPREILNDLLETVRHFGFTHLIYSGVPVGGQKLAPLVELNAWPASWFERYVAEDYAKTDGVCLYSARTLKPFIWSEVPEPLADTPSSRRVAHEATEFGIRSGFAVPMLSVEHWQSVLSFASPESACRLSDRERAQLITMAVWTGGAMQAMLEKEMPINLSDREREVLLWTAGGKNSWETSQILGISAETVKFHLANCRQKFGVAQSIQAVVEAIRRRVIHP